MFSRAATTFFYASVAFGLLAAATPNPGEKRWGAPTPTTVTVTAPAPTATEPAGNCNTEKLRCCNSVQKSDSLAALAALTLVGAVLQGVVTEVGLTCSPITVIGVGGNSGCSARPVCCENNSFGSAVSIGCVPVTL